MFIFVPDMSKQENDIIYFISFCIEQYKMRHGLTGSEAMQVFDQYGLTDYLSRNYEVLHTQSAQWLMEDMDEMIGRRVKT